MSRLVLGCGRVGHAIIDAVAERDGPLQVIEADESRVETLRNEGVSAERGDVTDPEVVGAAGPADVVVVAGDDPGVNRRAVEATRSAFPSAHLIAYVGTDATSAQRAAIEADADRTVDPGVALVDRIEGAFVGDATARARELRGVLATVEGTLGVFTHDNPDPDALASAIALEAVADSVGIEAEVCYYGEISHQENRALTNILDIELRALTPEDPIEYDAVALVDHSRPGVNSRLPPDTAVDIVIDHHPTHEHVEARFVDLREEAGATSTLATDYVRRFGVDPEGRLATGLLYGIRADTKEFRREVTAADFEAAGYLLPYADTDTIEQIESPSLTGETLEVVAAAIKNRRVEGSVVAACVGAVGDRDALSQAADRLLGMEGVAVTMVGGYTDGTIYVSARATGDYGDLGAVLRRAFDDIGSAGGHTDMAGAQVPLGLFDTVDDAELDDIVEGQVCERFFGALRNGSADDGPGAVVDAPETGGDGNS